MVDNNNNIYYVEFVDSNRKNQKIGETPNYCIPLTINAITVQGISYSDPYFSSFKLNYKMAFEAPEYMNKSDYAFKSSIRTLQIDPRTNEMQLLNKKSVNVCELNSETRMNDDDGNSKRKDHDNNVFKDDGDRAVFKAPRTFLNGDLTFDAMLELVEKEEITLKKISQVEETNKWGVPRRLRLCGGGETSLNNAAGWGSPPAPSSNGQYTSHPKSNY